jgi:hypothetical protein
MSVHAWLFNLLSEGECLPCWKGLAPSSTVLCLRAKRMVEKLLKKRQLFVEKDSLSFQGYIYTTDFRGKNRRRILKFSCLRKRTRKFRNFNLSSFHLKCEPKTHAKIGLLNRPCKWTLDDEKSRKWKLINLKAAPPTNSHESQPILFVALWHFVSWKFCQHDILSTWHFVNLTFCQLDILSTCHFVNMTFCQLVILSTWHFVNLPFFNLIFQSYIKWLGVDSESW